MSRLKPVLTASLLLMSVGAGLGAQQAGVSGSILFREVRLAESAASVRSADVLVVDGRIARIAAPASLADPAGGRTVNGGDSLFLAPGLVDAHVHISSRAPEWLPAFLGYGITTVFNLSGSPERLALRDQLARGELVGPALITSGPYTNAPAITDQESGLQAVRAQAEAGYDLIKIHGNLHALTYRAMVDEGRRLGVPVGGHIPRNLPGQRAIDYRQPWIAHAEEWIYTLFRDLDTSDLSSWAAEATAAGIRLTPTLTTFHGIRDQWGRQAAADSALESPEADVLDDRTRAYWASGNQYTGRPESDQARIAAMYDFQKHLVRAAWQAGMPLMLGSDTPVPVMVPGASLHGEITEFLAVGIPVEDIYRAATLSPAMMLRELAPRSVSDFGEVVEGALARLVLLSDNPLQSLDPYQAPLGVTVAGRWYDQEQLAAFRAGRFPSH